ncbi:histidine kinase [Hyunsoonleella sp. SJ7]|uniref:Histidine kinase n=1 Tax=Hyunsoonleella aquatilis TaxID=2762758 RepID=A0A923HDK1_9FLAO|nr:histidine kinase [Hyunsoonleella aquatilis]MBC3758173.1 histidine kinase [Hyunsoonleella aquatilis]
MKNSRKVVVHFLVWLVFALLLNSETLDLEWGAFDRKQGSLIIPLAYGLALSAFVFYYNVYKLIPSFFGKGKRLRYWFVSIALVLGVSFLETFIDILYLVFKNYELSKEQFEAGTIQSILLWYFMVFVSALLPNCICWILAFAFRLPKDWLIAEKQKNQLEKDKLQSELDFLKAQINPHFLFNGINSIYHLIGEDNDMAKNTLLQFSGLLRYQLYDCGVNFISVEKELNYINNYINIEEVRKGEDAVFTFNLPSVSDDSELKNYKIAPLLITPFLENAFKYLSHHSKRNMNFIDLDLSISNKGVLNMKLVNSFDTMFKTQKDSKGGIGLENVKRRLQLLYPNERHQLDIDASDNEFSVNLILNLNED